MKTMRFMHLIVLLALLLAVSLQPANGQAPAGGSPSNEALSPDGGDGDITPLTIALDGNPDYDSNWTPIAPGQTLTFTHNLGGDNTNNYWIDMEFWNGVSGINKSYYGGADINPTHDRVGAYWHNLTTSLIKVTRRAADPYAVKVRIRIWDETATQTYNHWDSLARTGTYTYPLQSGKLDPDKHLVDLRFNDSGTYGINQRFYGGKDCGPTASSDCTADAEEGANWYAMAKDTISVFRAKTDTSLGQPGDVGEQYHLQIWEMPKPTYTSGWLPITKGADLPISHNIGANADNFVVDLEFKSNLSNIGINQLYFGGARLGPDLARPYPDELGAPEEQVGAYWYGLTNSSISVHRNPDDHYADWVRVRIWNFWKPTPADYDSDWFTVEPGASVDKTPFNIPGGDAANYLVDLRFRNPSEGENQHNYGGNELGTKLDQGYTEDNVGAYWNNLGNDSISITRAPQDTTVAQARVRIWKMPTPDYDSGWTSILLNETKQLFHDLGGSVDNFLVDLQFWSSAYGTNNGGYGGFDTGTQSMTGLGSNQAVGAYWSKPTTKSPTTSDSILVTRRPNDIFAEKIRVRIWRMARPNYDSGITYIQNGQSVTLNHYLRQDPAKYFLFTTFFNGDFANGYNQAFFGGADLANNDRVGAFWYGLNPSRISVYHRTEDPTYAGNVRVRIWVTDFALYLPVARKN